MGDFLLSLLGEEVSLKVLMWLLGAVGTFLVAKVLSKVGSAYLRDTLMRLGAEIRAAVLECHQVYVDAIKKGREDGKLTPEEAAEAKRKTVEAIKSNLGTKGLKRLMRVLGIDEAGIDKYLGSHVEAHVAELKASPR